MLASSLLDKGYAPGSDIGKYYEIGICCFSTKHDTLQNTNKVSFALRQDNVSELSGIFTRRLLFQ